MQRQKTPNQEKNTSNKNENQEKIPEVIDLPFEAVENGFTNLNDWKNAKEAGFTNFSEWQEALENGFTQFSEWDTAKKGGFTKFTDWDDATGTGYTRFEDWNNAKIGGFTIFDEFENAKEAGFTNYCDWQEALENGFTKFSEWDIARKGRFENFNDWNNAKIGGFTSSNDWEKAKKVGFNQFEEWSKATKAGFETYDDWINAINEGFDTKEDWDDWVTIKESGFTDINLFYESKDIGFYQNSLRKAFLANLKLAKKGGFNSIQTWKEAQKWNINDFDEWLFITALHLQNLEEYVLVKEFQKKCLNLLDELYPNQEISMNRIVQLYAEDYAYNFSTTTPTDKVYKNFNRSRFENLLVRTIKQITMDSDIYKYSRLNDSVLKVAKEKFREPTQQIKLTRSNDITCPNCYNKIEKTAIFCPECGAKIAKCPICQSAMVGTSIGNCPHCGNSFHLNHLQEVIKISGQCPICKHELKDFDIINKD